MACVLVFPVLFCVFGCFGPGALLHLPVVLHTLSHRTGLFNDVDARVEPIKDKSGSFRLTFDFKEKLWPEMKSFEVKGASLIPKNVVAKVMQTHEPGPTTVHTLARIKNIIEGWYVQCMKLYCCMYLLVASLWLQQLVCPCSSWVVLHRMLLWQVPSEGLPFLLHLSLRRHGDGHRGCQPGGRANGQCGCGAH